MGWLFGQVWALCLVAFLLGALVTWSAFVTPPRRAAHRSGAAGPGWVPAGSWTALRGATSSEASAAPEPLPPGPAVDSALAVLDSWGDRRDRVSRPATGTAAAGALDLMGVGRAPDAAGGRPQRADDGTPQSGGGAAAGGGGGAAPRIPTQPGPPDVRAGPAPGSEPPRPRRGDTGGRRPPP